MWALAIAASITAADPTALGPGRHEYRLEAADYVWDVSVCVPKHQPTDRLPVVLILHGAGATGAAYLDKCGWAAKAEKERFIAVAPNGQAVRPRMPSNGITNPRIWNTEQIRTSTTRAKIDDLAFVRALLDDLARRAPIDPDRIYAVGHSNGAGLAFQLAVEMCDRFAAVAVYGGYNWMVDPKPVRARPAFFVVGMQDPLTPIDGGGIRPGWAISKAVPSVAESLGQYARGIGCTGEPRKVGVTNGITMMRYGPGANGATLDAWYIEGQGHIWPGGQGFVLPALEEQMLGPQSHKIVLTDVMWDYFRQHPRR